MAKAKAVIGIDIGATAVKVVELSNRDEALSVTGVAREPYRSEDDIPEAVQTAMAVGGFRARRMAVSLSGRGVLVRPITIPDGPIEDLRENTVKEAEKYIPYDVADAQIDCHPLSLAPDGQRRVLLVAARRQMLEDLLERLRTAGIHPAIVDYDGFALYNAFEVAAVPPPTAANVVVDVGATKTSVAVFRGADSFFREIYIAGDALTDAVGRRLSRDAVAAERTKLSPGEDLETVKDAMYPVFEELAGEIRSAIDYFQTQFEVRPEKVHLSGGTFQFPGVDGLLGKLLGLEPKTLDPFAGVKMNLADDEALRKHKPEFTVAFGLAARVRD